MAFDDPMGFNLRIHIREKSTAMKCKLLYCSRHLALAIKFLSNQDSIYILRQLSVHPLSAKRCILIPVLGATIDNL